MSRGGFAQFREAMGQRESGGNYACVNAYGFLGRYQFGLPRLCDLGLVEKTAAGFTWRNGLSKERFLADHALQDDTFRRHVIGLKNAVWAHAGGQLGSIVDGVQVTLSGCVAVCHLLGLGGLQDFLRGTNGADALGTTAKDYMSLFGDYDLPTPLL